MLSENRWKVILLVAASVAAVEPTRALSIVYQKPYKNIMFVPRNYYRRRARQRVLFLDEDENRQPYGRGEIDLTKNTRIKFDDNTDYEFTSPGEGTEQPKSDDGALPSGNERFYEPPPRFRPFQTQPQYYQGRFARPYAPNFGFEPYKPAPFSPALRNGYYPGWRARSPRVVFPYATDSVPVQTNSHAGPGGFDNVVFRDQNFDVNDVGDEQALQDIGTGSGDGFPDKDANDPHRAQNKMAYKKSKITLEKPMFIQTEGLRKLTKRNDYFVFPNVTNKLADLPKFKPISDEQMMKVAQILSELPISTNVRKGRLLEQTQSTNVEAVTEGAKVDRLDENCQQGGTCEFFFYCWMIGGLLDGSCGSLLKGCCHRVAKAGVLGVHDSNSLEYSPNEGLSYGPVINDESKSVLKTEWQRHAVTPLRNFVCDF